MSSCLAFLQTVLHQEFGHDLAVRQDGQVPCHVYIAQGVIVSIQPPSFHAC